MHKIGVAAVLKSPVGEVLLVRTETAGWELPGGRVEAGEDLLQALTREVYEESGCTLNVDRLVGMYAHVGSGLLIVVFGGTSSTTSPAPSPGDDCLEAGWFGPDEALRRVTHPIEHQTLADALANEPGVAYRAYPGDESMGPIRL